MAPTSRRLGRLCKNQGVESVVPMGAPEGHHRGYYSPLGLLPHCVSLLPANFSMLSIMAYSGFVEQAQLTVNQIPGLPKAERLANPGGRAPESISWRLTHSCSSVCGTQPIVGGDQLDGRSLRRVLAPVLLNHAPRTFGTSGENLFDLVMAQSSQSIGPPPKAERFTNHTSGRLLAAGYDALRCF